MTTLPLPVRQAQADAAPFFSPEQLDCEIRECAPWVRRYTTHPFLVIDGIAIEFDEHALGGITYRVAVHDGIAFVAAHGHPCTDERARQIAAKLQIKDVHFHEALQEWLDGGNL